jgi:hypothetical protein
MKRFLQRWFGGASRPGAVDVGGVQAWAEGQGWRFARARGVQGFAIETGQLRIEWGPPQRAYIEPAELRVRAELGALGELQLLLMSRALATVLEAEVFEQATEDNRTRVDDRTPEEMRWLVLHPKLPRAELGPLADHYCALSNHRRAAAAWLDAALRAPLESHAATSASGPLVVTVQRGRLVLRQALALPTVQALQSALTLATAAATSAQSVARELASGNLESTNGSAWGPSALPPGEGGAR